MRGEATPWAPGAGVWAMMACGAERRWGVRRRLRPQGRGGECRFQRRGGSCRERGNIDELGAEAFGGLDAPAAADAGSGLGLLRDDATGGNGGGIEVIVVGQFQAMLEGDRSASAGACHGIPGTATSRPWMANLMLISVEARATMISTRTWASRRKKRIMPDQGSGSPTRGQVTIRVREALGGR